MLTIQSLTRPGLSAADLTFGKGEAVAITGPSGAGKSLFLRAIADLDPNDGDIRLEGVSRAELPAPCWRQRVTYLAAVPGWWAQRVGEHIPDDLRGAARDLLARLQLPNDALDWPVSRLSTGEAQRLSLLRALIQNPVVLLLDEPTGALDDAATAAVEAELLRRIAEGLIVLVVTHDSDQAERLCRRRLHVAPGGRVREESR